MLQDLAIVDLTAPALLGITVILILTGRLVPRIHLLEKDKQIAEWREAYEKEHEARALSDSQTTELLELAKTSNAILTAMFGGGGVLRRSGGSNVAEKK